MRSPAIGLVWLVAGCGRIGFGAVADRSADAAGDAAGAGFSHLVAYADQTCALHAGRVYCWGDNGSGQLGDGTTMDRGEPREVMLPAGAVVDFTLGESHGCAVVDGDVYCWGALGTPAPVAVPLPGGARATAIGAGRDFTCVIAGDVYCWGKNDRGQLGVGGGPDLPAPTTRANFPIDPTTISVGDDHACANGPGLASLCWGHNDNGVLGADPSTSPEVVNPTSIGGGTSTLSHIAGWHSCALTGGTVACLGRGIEGELGDGANTDSTVPRQVKGLAGVTAIATGGGPTDLDASCAVTAGAVWCWGVGLFGRLGQGTEDPASTPVAVQGLPGPAAEIAIGYDHACALLTDDDIWCWGKGVEGQLGDGRLTSSSSPVRVLGP